MIQFFRWKCSDKYIFLSLQITVQLTELIVYSSTLIYCKIILVMIQYSRTFTKFNYNFKTYMTYYIQIICYVRYVRKCYHKSTYVSHSANSKFMCWQDTRNSLRGRLMRRDNPNEYALASRALGENETLSGGKLAGVWRRAVRTLSI